MREFTRRNGTCNRSTKLFLAAGTFLHAVWRGRWSAISSSHLFFAIERAVVGVSTSDLIFQVFSLTGLPLRIFTLENQNLFSRRAGCILKLHMLKRRSVALEMDVFWPFAIHLGASLELLSGMEVLRKKWRQQPTTSSELAHYAKQQKCCEAA